MKRYGMDRAGWIIGTGMMLVIAACTPTSLSSPTRLPDIAPQDAVHTLAQADSPQAPAAAAHAVTMFAWAGADTQEPRLYAQSETGSPTILALKVTTPLDVMTYPAANDRFHLLWRDDVDGRLHLFYSLFNDRAVAELAAYDVAEQPMYAVAVLPQNDQSLRLVYSAGWVAEPRLFLQEIDGQGRSQFPIPLNQAGDRPALLAMDQTVWLFWQTEDGRVWQSPLEGGTLVDPQAVLMTPSLAPGDDIRSVTAAADATYRYLFWQVVRADGTPETWYAVGEKTGSTWSPVLRLSIPTLGTGTLQTGYHVGEVSAVERGAEDAGWSAPLPGLQPLVPLAVQLGDTLGIAYLQAGNIIGYQRVAQVGPLISAPLLILRPDRSLVVTWTAPGDTTGTLNWIAP